MTKIHFNDTFTSYYIELPYAVFLISHYDDNGVVFEAPPVAKWMIGKQITSALSWVRGKKGKIIKL